MNHPPEPVLFPPELSDEAAYQILDFLHTLTTELENPLYKTIASTGPAKYQ